MGSLFELFRRYCGIHEAQQFSGHTEISNVVGYGNDSKPHLILMLPLWRTYMTRLSGMLMQLQVNQALIGEMSRPSVGDAFELRSAEVVHYITLATSHTLPWSTVVYVTVTVEA